MQFAPLGGPDEGRAAGFVPSAAGETVKDVIAAESRLLDLPMPPQNVQRWRRPTEPGAMHLHPGYAQDQQHKAINIYGKPRNTSESIKDIVDIAPKSDIEEMVLKKKEAIYRSTKREPLGKSYVRGHELPQELLHRGFGVVNPQDVEGDLSKETLYPPEGEHEPRATHQMYLKSHHSFHPGEQRQRNYQWVDKHGQIDPRTYGFGKIVHERQVDGVAKAFNPDLDPTIPKPSAIITRRLEDHKQVASFPLGKSISLAQGKTFEAGHVFGKPSQDKIEWGVGELMGYGNADEEPDIDLGRSVRPGFRNIAPDNRVFGIPSIRTDVPPPTQKSVADHQSYGDEMGAGELLNPPPFSDGGVAESDFVEARSLGDLMTIFRGAGWSLDDDTFRQAYEEAASMDPAGFVSAHTMRKVLDRQGL